MIFEEWMSECLFIRPLFLKKWSPAAHSTLNTSRVLRAVPEKNSITVSEKPFCMGMVSNQSRHDEIVFFLFYDNYSVLSIK